MLSSEPHTECVAAFGPGQVVRNLRRSVTEEVIAACPDATERAVDAANAKGSKGSRRNETQRKIRERWIEGAGVNIIACVGAGNSNASVIDEGGRK